MFGALKRGFRSMASLILVRNVVGELRPKRTLAASRGFIAAARLSCVTVVMHLRSYSGGGTTKFFNLNLNLNLNARHSNQ